MTESISGAQIDLFIKEIERLQASPIFSGTQHEAEGLAAAMHAELQSGITSNLLSHTIFLLNDKHNVAVDKEEISSIIDEAWDLFSTGAPHHIANKVKLTGDTGIDEYLQRELIDVPKQRAVDILEEAFDACHHSSPTMEEETGHFLDVAMINELKRLEISNEAFNEFLDNKVMDLKRLVRATNPTAYDELDDEHIERIGIFCRIMTHISLLPKNLPPDVANDVKNYVEAIKDAQQALLEPIFGYGNDARDRMHAMVGMFLERTKIDFSSLNEERSSDHGI